MSRLSSDEQLAIVLSLEFQERFWSKVEIPISDLTGEPNYGVCWLWTGSITRGSTTYRSNPQRIYGHLKLTARSTIKAHRAALAIVTGMLPADMDAAHHVECSSGLCVNAHRHLRWQAPLDNRVHDVNGRYGGAIGGRPDLRRGVRHWS